MNSLIYNLLHELSQTSNCADNVWSVVSEFSAAESEYEAKLAPLLAGHFPATSSLATSAWLNPHWQEAQSRRTAVERLANAADAMVRCLLDEQNSQKSHMKQLFHYEAKAMQDSSCAPDAESPPILSLEKNDGNYRRGNS